MTHYRITYAPKIVKTSFGLIAGSGLVDLVDAVAGRVARQPPGAVGGITTIIREERDRFSGPTHLNDGTNVMDHTVWFVTAELPGSGVRVYYFTPENDYLAFPLSIGKPLVIMPMDAPSGLEDQVLKHLIEEVRPMSTGINEDENILYHTKLIGRMIAQVSRSSATVSAAYQVGFQALGKGPRLSQVLSSPEHPPVFD